MKVIFDLDYTLLDTSRLKKDLTEIIPRRNFMDDYHKYFKDKKVNFNLDKYLEILKRKEGASEAGLAEIRHKFTGLFSKLDEYLFPAAAELLKIYQDRGDGIILVSFGDKDLQEQKINNLSIKQFFEQIIIEDEDKKNIELWRELKDGGEKVLIINDKADESLKMLKELNGQAELLLIDGPYSRNIEHNQKIYSLDELLVNLNNKKILKD